jgi:hypothetical protein
MSYCVPGKVRKAKSSQLHSLFPVPYYVLGSKPWETQGRNPEP